MNPQDAYTSWSATYDTDRNLTRDLDQLATRTVLAELHCKSILEVGCGTGKNTALLAHIGEKVRAFDLSAGMLRQARQKLRSDNVAFAIADLTQPWPCTDRSADLIVCNLVLEHIRDLTFIFGEVRRTLLGGGRFFICELHPFRQYQGTQAIFKRERETIAIQAYVHHLSDFLEAADANGLALINLREWWHAEDQDQPPRLMSFMFEKRA